MLIVGYNSLAELVLYNFCIKNADNRHSLFEFDLN